VADLSDDKRATELTRGMAAGDARAIEEFYRRYFDLMYSQARRVTRRDEAFCLDVVQEAVIKVVRLVRAVESQAQLTAWLRLVVRTTAYDLCKAERRRQIREGAAAVNESIRPAGNDNEQIGILRGELARLDPELASLIDLRFRQRLTLGRIASLLGLSIGTVDGRLRRALRMLRSRLEDDSDV
jgi:RNA polymerase sigma-70 factor (ECF subfamily)